MWPRAIAEAELLVHFLSERLEVHQRIYSYLRRIIGLERSTPNMVSAPTVTERWNHALASGS